MQKLTLIIALPLLLLTDCKKPAQQAIINFSDLSFKQGNSWVYSRYDSAVNKKDTVTISIPTFYVRNDTTFFLLVQVATGEIDTATMLFENNILSCSRTTGPIPALNMILFPLTPGSTWGNFDTAFYYANNLQVNGRTYKNVFQIKQTPLAYPDFPPIENIYLSKGIGIVSYNQNNSPAATAISNLMITNYQWDLLSYHLN